MSSSLKKLLVATVAVVIVLLFAGTVYFLFAKNATSEEGFKAVFLTNGQVYFGKITHEDGHYVKLEDIYYLQLKQPLQNQGAVQQTDSDMALIKFGKEMHGPTDQMEINRDHIIFTEDLAPDSKVVKAIEDYKKR